MMIADSLTLFIKEMDGIAQLPAWGDFEVLWDGYFASRKWGLGNS